MTCLVAVDPGLHITGIAIFLDGLLVGADYIPNRSVKAWVKARSQGQKPTWCREKMQMYVRDPSKHSTLKAIEKRMRAFRIKWAAQYYPNAWKGQVPKEIHHPRLARILDPAELLVFDAADHNGKDAAGIGLFHLGRIGKGGKLLRPVGD